MMKLSDKGFTPLQMDNSPNIDYGNISSKISKRKRFLSYKKGAGFTLLELMFGISVLLVAIIATLSSFINCVFLSQSSRNLATAANDAQYVLEQIKALDYDSCIKNIPSDCYTLPTFTNLNVAFEPAPTIVGGNPNIKQITVKVSWTERQKSRSFSLATYFAK